MKRRLAVSVIGASALLTACLHNERFFDLEWDEEVKLHDGRVIVVHIKHRYMRIAGRFFGYSDVSVPIDSTLTLDTGTSAGKVVQYFKGFRPILLDQHEGIWYVVLTGRYYPGSRETAGQDWGDLQGPYSQRAVHLINSKWQPMNLCDLPEELKKPNMLLLNAEAKRFAVFNKQRINLLEKHHHEIEFPSDPPNIAITKPLANTRYSCTSKSIQTHQEQPK